MKVLSVSSVRKKRLNKQLSASLVGMLHLPVLAGNLMVTEFDSGVVVSNEAITVDKVSLDDILKLDIEQVGKDITCTNGVTYKARTSLEDLVYPTGPDVFEKIDVRS